MTTPIYITVVEPTLSRLENTINLRIQEGYTVYDTFQLTGTPPIYVQPMIHELEEFKQHYQRNLLKQLFLLDQKAKTENLNNITLASTPVEALPPDAVVNAANEKLK